MVFSSIPFLFYFLPLFLAFYILTPSTRAKNVVLLLASLLFYAWGEPWFVLVLAGQTLMNYALALAINANTCRLRAITTGFGIAANLALLGVFKYADFAVGSWNALASDGWTFALPGLALPLGISFFTFHSISYLVDVHRGQVAPNRSLLEVSVYIAMFPQLVAGPIIRYHTIAHLLHERRMTLGRASAGLRIFIIGLAQKVLIADEVARIAEAVFDKVAAPGAIEAWIGLFAYTVQIYFDFVGYSNMAIGLGLALGFIFPRNFNLPYTARSIADFWRRWHMSLSQWLRDYLYIPLGGSRGSAIATYRNLWLVFILCGLWHGASWTFVIWGIHHGFFLVLERAGLGAVLARAPAAIARIYALLAVMSGWVWFRAHDFDHALRYFKSLIGMNGAAGLHLPTHLTLYPVSIAALACGVLLGFFNLAALRRGRFPAMPRLAALNDTAWIGVLFVLSILSVAAGSYSPFLYFRF